MPFITPDLAAKLLAKQEVVAIPTETVYGLAGSIYSETALRKIFQIKERPFTDPLIVHVASIDQAKKLTPFWHPTLEALAEKFWPGPLTLVLEKKNDVSALITSGLKSVGVRMPDHSLTLALIENCGSPLAAPSANKFGKTSPTHPDHVAEEFGGELSIVDGGSCTVGIESSVLSVKILSENLVSLSLLRKGKISLKEITDFLDSQKLPYTLSKLYDKNLSPGQMKRHYMPRKPLVILNQKLNQNEMSDEFLQLINLKLKDLPIEEEGVRVTIPDNVKSFVELTLNTDPEQAGRELYFKLRDLANKETDIIIFHRQECQKGEFWEAILERLNKAACLHL